VYSNGFHIVNSILSNKIKLFCILWSVLIYDMVCNYKIMSRCTYHTMLSCSPYMCPSNTGKERSAMWPLVVEVIVVQRDEGGVDTVGVVTMVMEPK
jgi:hypothetical protein